MRPASAVGPDPGDGGGRARPGGHGADGESQPRESPPGWLMRPAVADQAGAWPSLSSRPLGRAPRRSVGLAAPRTARPLCLWGSHPAIVVRRLPITTSPCSLAQPDRRGRAARLAVLRGLAGQEPERCTGTGSDLRQCSEREVAASRAD